MENKQNKDDDIFKEILKGESEKTVGSKRTPYKNNSQQNTTTYKTPFYYLKKNFTTPQKEKDPFNKILKITTLSKESSYQTKMLFTMIQTLTTEKFESTHNDIIGLLTEFSKKPKPIVLQEKLADAFLKLLTENPIPPKTHYLLIGLETLIKCNLKIAHILSKKSNDLPQLKEIKILHKKINTHLNTLNVIKTKRGQDLLERLLSLLKTPLKKDTK